MRLNDVENQSKPKTSDQKQITTGKRQQTYTAYGKLSVVY